MNTDYCIKPSTQEPIVPVETVAPTEAATMGETEMIVALETVGDTNEGLPLGLCQGDCDSNGMFMGLCIDGLCSLRVLPNPLSCSFKSFTS